MKLKVKVLIIGGGPAGAIAARRLAEWGVEVMLLERDLSFHKPCGGGVPVSAFDELHIPRNLIRKEVKAIRIISPSRKTLDIELKGGSLAIVDRGEFDRILRDKAERQGVEVVEGECRGVESEGKHYKVEATNKRGKRQVVAEYLIAADGVNSRVRAALGIRPTRATFTVSERIKEVKTDFCEFWFGSTHAPGGYSWVFPTTEGISAGTASIKPGMVITLFRRFKERRGIPRDGLKRIYKIPLWEGDLFNRGKIMFVGDSAGQVMPFTYEGIYYAMKAGEFAARGIIEEKADNYERIWKARFQKRFAFMDKLKNYFFRNDLTTERLVALHRRPEIQEASMRLWLIKDSSREGLQRYIKLFERFLC